MINKNINIGAVILARADSKRLPGKVLMKLDGDNEIFTLIYKNLKSLKLFSKIIIATSREKSDEEITKTCQLKNLEYFNGDKENVFDRLLKASLANKFDYVCRFNADSPFLSKELIIKGIKRINDKKYSLVTNTIIRSFPYGITFQAFDVNFLKEVNQNNLLSEFEKEHISPIYKYIEKEKISILKNNRDLSNIRMVIDNEEDLKNIKNLNLKETKQFLKWEFYAKLLEKI